MQRIYVCGTIGAGLEDDHYRPEIADDPCFARDGTGWGASHELLSFLPPQHGDRWLVECYGLTDEEHAEIGYSDTNPNGFDWLEVDGDEVTVHAPA